MFNGCGKMSGPLARKPFAFDVFSARLLLMGGLLKHEVEGCNGLAVLRVWSRVVQGSVDLTSG